MSNEFERARKNIVCSPGLMEKFKIAASEAQNAWYKSKYWIFWRIALWLHNTRKRLVEKIRKKKVMMEWRRALEKLCGDEK